MRRDSRFWTRIVWSLSFTLLSLSAAAAQVQVVNMVPTINSGETQRDSEPNIAVDPKAPLSIAASAFTPDPNATLNGVLYFSNDGGQNWNLTNAFIPASQAVVNCFMTFCDITLRFAGTSDLLYVGDLIEDNAGNTNLTVGQVANVGSNARTYTLMETRNGGMNNFPDQPWVQATTVLEGVGTGNDHTYVGNNNTQLMTDTASVDLSLNPQPPPPSGFNADVIDTSATCQQDGPSVRSAIHLDGTVYVAFFRWTANCFGAPGTAEVVMLRDDNWGTGPNAFQALHDLNNATVGQRIRTGIQIPWLQLLGNQRVGSQLAIAVDPNNSGTVYVAWGDGGTGATYALHVRHSTDHGQHWDNADIRTINTATNPGLAINSHGKVAFLYQQLAGGNWQTIVERTTNAFANHQDLTLANVPDQKGPGYFGSNPIGDYDNLISSSKDFYGIFSGFNTANNTNFPNGVTYLRYADFAAHQLYADAGHTMPVADSIDPFFFHITEMAADQDFYVRDWTNSMTDHDDGQEPSTNTFFWTNSDVWNRATNSAGMPNANDQYSTDPMQAGMLAAGDNFAFVRVHRNGTGSAASVTAHFMVSPFGTGSNFQDAGVAADPTLNFAAPDTVQVLSTGYQWHQDPTASTHSCIAVQITGPNDAFILPSLVGTAPGWPAGVAIVEDNNKAQRNLDVSHNMADTGATDFALIHNAALVSRDIQLRYELPADQTVKGQVQIVGGEGKPLRSRDSIILKNMQPGENRWIGLHLTQPGVPLLVNFFEMDKGREVNGFTIVAQPAALPDVIAGNLREHSHAFLRLALSFKLKDGKAESLAADRLLRGSPVSAAQYTAFLKQHVKAMNRIIARLVRDQKTQDAFGIMATLAALQNAVQQNNTGDAASSHSALLNQLDAFTTMLQKANGDPADIVQMVRWQEDLYSTRPKLTSIGCSRFLVNESEKFLESYGTQPNHSASYTHLMKELVKCLEKTAERLEKGHRHLEKAADKVEDSRKSVPKLEKAHRDFLIELAAATQ